MLTRFLPTNTTKTATEQQNHYSNEKCLEYLKPLNFNEFKQKNTLPELDLKKYDRLGGVGC